MVQPTLVLNFFAILTSVVAAMIVGFLWYGPLFGKVWGRAMGLAADFKPDSTVMLRAMGIQIFGLLLTAYVLAHSGQVWRPSVWNLGPDQMPDAAWGAMSALFTWIGFYVPMQANKVAWEGRSWTLFFINTGHDLLILMVMSQILAHWR